MGLFLQALKGQFSPLSHDMFADFTDGTNRLELGAGGGLVGLAVARGCKVEAPLYITDQLEMEELMQHNIALNGLKDRVKGAILNW
jgi:tRNA1(Val) A37 N6-methylase TrmN6